MGESGALCKNRGLTTRSMLKDVMSATLCSYLIYLRALSNIYKIVAVAVHAKNVREFPQHSARPLITGETRNLHYST